jgi:NADPH:quinone reductase-like Zn-dependent oxidoreductase
MMGDTGAVIDDTPGAPGLKTGTVLVTGGSGFVATHLVSRLLDRGYTVRASVRSLASAEKVEPLRRLGAGHGRDHAGVLGPRFGLTPDYIAKHLGISFAVDNHRSLDELGLVYRPVRETMLDHYESWRARRARPR